MHVIVVDPRILNAYFFHHHNISPKIYIFQKHKNIIFSVHLIMMFFESRYIFLEILKEMI